MAIAATENDSLYALDQATGKVAVAQARRHPGAAVRTAVRQHRPARHHRHAVYDPSSGIVYAVAETSGYHHVLVGISVTDGRLEVERDIPTPDGRPADRPAAF